MLYCAKCQLLVREDECCPVCGSRKLREVESTDPVMLMTTDRTAAEAILAAFQDGNIPCEQRDSGPGSLPAFFPRASYDSVNLFVPFEATDRCREILTGMGILGEREQRRKKEAPDPPEEQTEPMSPARKTILRILSAIAFILLIFAVVFLSDKAVSFVKAFFHLG